MSEASRVRLIAAKTCARRKTRSRVFITRFFTIKGDPNNTANAVSSRLSGSLWRFFLLRITAASPARRLPSLTQNLIARSKDLFRHAWVHFDLAMLDG
jgi:hypothetical protein